MNFFISKSDNMKNDFLAIRQRDTDNTVVPLLEFRKNHNIECVFYNLAFSLANIVNMRGKVIFAI